MKFKACRLAALTCAALLSFHASAEVLDSTAAVVNNDIILESELDDATAQVTANAAQKNVRLDPISARRSAMEHLITSSLVTQIAKQRGIEMTDMQLDQTLNEMAVKNRVSAKKILESFAPGQSEAKQREAFRREFLIDEIRRQTIRSRINISDSEARTVAKQLKERGSIEPRYHIGQIIVPLSTNPSEEEYNRAEAASRAVKSELSKGVPFEEVFARYSSGSRQSGAGDLGYVPETRVPLPFVPGLVKGKPGDVIGPIRSPIGLHFVKLFDVSHDAVQPVKTYRASHILIKTSVILSDDAARAELMRIKQDIKNGTTTFAQAARKYSEDPGSASKGGDLGYQSPGMFDPAFAQAMVSLQPGQISDPIHSSYGWHIIWLRDVKTDSDSEEAYLSRAREILYERAYQEQSALWEKQLRDSSYVHITDPALLDAGINLEHSGSQSGDQQK
jgi:peptidyl-prolyl cis-trans isomerase SurA